MNINTANAWKNLRRAFTLSVGTCLSAASSQSIATFDMFAPLGRFDKLGKLGKLNPSGPADSGGGVDGALGSLASTLLELPAFVPRTAPSKVLWWFSTMSPAALTTLRWRYLRDRASCLFHPATLMLPSAAQYTRSAGRLHFVLPSRIQNSAHTHGSRLPNSQRVHRPMSPPTISTAPT